MDRLMMFLTKMLLFRSIIVPSNATRKKQTQIEEDEKVIVAIQQPKPNGIWTYLK
jgi:hypothetical protein